MGEHLGDFPTRLQVPRLPKYMTHKMGQHIHDTKHWFHSHCLKCSRLHPLFCSKMSNLRSICLIKGGSTSNYTMACGVNPSPTWHTRVQMLLNPKPKQSPLWEVSRQRKKSSIQVAHGKYGTFLVVNKRVVCGPFLFGILLYDMICVNSFWLVSRERIHIPSKRSWEDEFPFSTAWDMDSFSGG